MRTKIIAVATHYDGAGQQAFDELGSEWKVESFTPIMTTKENAEGETLSEVVSCFLVCSHAGNKSFKHKAVYVPKTNPEKWIEGINTAILANELDGWGFVFMLPHTGRGQSRGFQIVLSMSADLVSAE